MADLKLNIENRNESGKADARRIRRVGKVPAVIYGEDLETSSLVMDAHAFELIMKEDQSLIELDWEGKKHRAIVRDIQRHPVTGNILHVDFFLVKAGQKVTLSVSLRYEGKPSGVKEGGNFQTVKNELEINVLPKDIPDYIEVEISELEMGQNLRVSDIQAENFEILDDPDEVICRVEVPKVEEEVVEEEEEEGEEEESAEPEVITARDKEEESE